MPLPALMLMALADASFVLLEVGYGDGAAGVAAVICQTPGRYGSDERINAPSLP